MFANEGNALRYRVTAASGAGFLLFGYDQGVFGGILSNRPFLDTFNNPSSTIQGQIVATYDIGCIMGTILSMFIEDILGRRRCIVIGCTILIIGGIMQAASYSLSPMIVGRVVAGVGNGMNTIAIPVWQSETARPTSRGRLIVLQMVTNIFGIVITNVRSHSTHSSSQKYLMYLELSPTDGWPTVDELWVHLCPEQPGLLEISTGLSVLFRPHHNFNDACRSGVSALVGHA